MRVSTGDSHHDNFFYIRGVIHKGYDHIGSAGTKCGMDWYSERSDVSIYESPQKAQEVHGNLYGGVTLCPKCFKLKKETIEYFKKAEAKILRLKAKSLIAKAKELGSN